MTPRKQLARLIERSGLSLRELSSRTRIHRNHLQELLGGDRPLGSLPLNKLHALFQALGHPGRLPLFPLGYPLPVYGALEEDLAHGTTPLPTRFAYLALPLEPPPASLFLASITRRTPQPEPPLLPPGYVLLGPPRGGWGPVVWTSADGEVYLRPPQSLREPPSIDHAPLAQVLAWYPPRSLQLHDLEP